MRITIGRLRRLVREMAVLDEVPAEFADGDVIDETDDEPASYDELTDVKAPQHGRRLQGCD